jgi:hypothetical protein
MIDRVALVSERTVGPGFTVPGYSAAALFFSAAGDREERNSRNNCQKNNFFKHR